MIETSFTIPPSLSREFLLEHQVCPFAWSDDGRIRVAVTPEASSGALDEVGLAAEAPTEIVSMSRPDVELLIERLTSTSALAPSPEVDPVEGTDVQDIRALAHEAPVVRYLNLLLKDAVDARASDIHLEATRDGLRVRLRVDGVLVQADPPPFELRAAVVSRVKLLAEMDIAERRRPQDGRLRLRFDGREMDVRVATAPTSFGESVVLRLLDRSGRPVSLLELGMPEDLQRAVASAVARPQGLFLVTGPTGSGKTSPLYASLQLRAADREKIVTVEDPIEYQLPGVTQIQVHRPSGVTFASALRAILRQDPDVIMVGEMRDTETAEVAIQAALTGHLVLATLHTNDAVSAIPRLLDLGIPAYLVAATLSGVLAQRLVRRVCDACHGLGNSLGCQQCLSTGYFGRIGVFQWVMSSPSLLAAVSAGKDATELSRIAESEGTQSLLSAGNALVESRITTRAEVARVLLA